MVPGSTSLAFVWTANCSPNLRYMNMGSQVSTDFSRLKVVHSFVLFQDSIFFSSRFGSSVIVEKSGMNFEHHTTILMNCSNRFTIWGKGQSKMEPSLDPRWDSHHCGCEPSSSSRCGRNNILLTLTVRPTIANFWIQNMLGYGLGKAHTHKKLPLYHQGCQVPSPSGAGNFYNNEK